MSLPSSPAKSSRLHLPYLDGIRALCALYVVNHHLLSAVSWKRGQGGFWFQGVDLGAYGHYPVVIFIVLSGYCLMLPVARAGGELKGGFWHYITRRARRILPPYYASLTFSLLWVAIIAHRHGHPFFGMVSQQTLLSHVLLIHNLRPEWIYKINGPMWSIATEWQIYFFFPLLLLPVWKKFGNLAAVVAGFMACALLWVPLNPLAQAAPWFIGVFALGMSAAVFNFDPRYATPLHKWPWKWMAIGSFVLGFALVRFIPGFSWYRAGNTHPFYPLSDVVFGCGTAALLVGCTRQVAEGAPPNAVLRFFSWAPLVKIGTFSYSIYLIHAPILEGFRALNHWVALHSIAGYLYLASMTFLASLGLGYLFYLAFERPFMSTRRRHDEQIETTVSTAIIENPSNDGPDAVVSRL